MKKFRMNDPILKFLPSRVIPRKVMILPILALVIIGILWGLISLLLLPNRVYNGGTDYILYVKNNDLYLTDNQSQPINIAANFFRPWIRNGEIYTDVELISDYIVISDNKDRIFYPANYDGHNYTLSYLDLSDLQKSSKRIGRNLHSCIVSDDGSTLIGLDFFGKLQQYSLPGQKLVIEDNISAVYSGDMQTLYWEQNSSLYKKAGEAQKEIISADFNTLNGLWATGELYFSSPKKAGGYRHIYYYDGKKATVLLENVLDSDFAQTQPVGIIHAERMSNDIWYFVSGGQLHLLEDPQIQDAIMSPYGNMLAYVTSCDNGNTALYTAEVFEGQLGEPVKMDTNVSLDTVTFLENSSLTYFKNRNDNAGDLYIDGEQIDSNVALYKYKYSDYWAFPPSSQTTLAYCRQTGTTVYYTDFDPKQETGVLKLYNGETSVVIDEEVADFRITQAGDVFYLRVYDFDRYTGQLWVYRGGERHLVDKNVTALIPLRDN